MQEVTGSIPVISTRKRKHCTEMCGAFLLLPNERGPSSAGRAPCMDCKRVTVIRIGPVISTRMKKHYTGMCGAFLFYLPFTLTTPFVKKGAVAK